MKLQIAYVLSAIALMLAFDVIEANASEPYRIRAGDELHIRLSGVPGRGTYVMTVPQNGELVLPFLHPLNAEGLTVSELQEKIRRTYIDEGIYRQLAVNIDLESNAYFIRGEVENPGRYPLPNDWTLAQAIDAAGGFTEAANPPRIEIIRQGNRILATPLLVVSRGDIIIVSRHRPVEAIPNQDRFSPPYRAYEYVHPDTGEAVLIAEIQIGNHQPTAAGDESSSPPFTIRLRSEGGVDDGKHGHIISLGFSELYWEFTATTNGVTYVYTLFDAGERFEMVRGLATREQLIGRVESELGPSWQFAERDVVDSQIRYIFKNEEGAEWIFVKQYSEQYGFALQFGGLWETDP